MCEFPVVLHYGGIYGVVSKRCVESFQFTENIRTRKFFIVYCLITTYKAKRTLQRSIHDFTA